MTFQVNHQALLSGNNRFFAWIILGCVLAFPLPIYVIPIALLSQFALKDIWALTWVMVWINVSTTIWLWCILFALYLFVEKARLSFYSLCFLPLVFKFLQFDIEFILPILFSSLVLFTPRSNGLRTSIRCSLMMVAYVLVSAMVVWHQGNIDSLHRIGILSLWKTSNPLSVDVQKKIISLDPLDHEWILEQPLSLEDKINSGWRPERAPMIDEQRISIARILDQHSRRGEALRTLKRQAATHPKVAWEYIRILRLDGDSYSEGMKYSPPEQDIIQDFHQVDEWWSQNHCKNWFIHTESPQSIVSLEFGVETGPNQEAKLEVEWDALRKSGFYSAGTNTISHKFKDNGPHTLHVCFTNDSYTQDNDINVHVKYIDITQMG